MQKNTHARMMTKYLGESVIAKNEIQSVFFCVKPSSISFWAILLLLFFSFYLIHIHCAFLYSIFFQFGFIVYISTCKIRYTTFSSINSKIVSMKSRSIFRLFFTSSPLHSFESKLLIVGTVCTSLLFYSTLTLTEKKTLK